MLCHYVGSRKIAKRVGLSVRGVPITSAADATRWAASVGEDATEITVTFVVGEEGRLLVADRHSEHVACASGRPVRDAGEMCFALEGGRVSVMR